MGRRKCAVFVLTVLFLALIGLTDWKQVQWENFPFSVVVESDGRSEKISCWKTVPDTFYVFLPGYTECSQAHFCTNRFYPVSVEGRRLDDGASCEDFPLDVPLNMTYTRNGKTYQHTLIFTQSGNVSTMYIDVSSGSMDYIHQEKGNSESGVLRLYTPEGNLDCAAQLESISGRGNSTWGGDKKAYSLTLASQSDLLGMGTANDWILLANYYDSTNLCNKMTYDFAAEVGAAYSPEAQWVDLYLNGEYAGLYLLTERNEIHPQRVAISEKESFLISKELVWQVENQSKSFFTSDRNNILLIRNTGMPEQKIQDIWQSAENAIYAQNGIDPETGMDWQELIDLDSWAQQFLLSEVFVNYDASNCSMYFYYEPGSGKVFAGPIWDMDNILNRCGTQPPNILASARHYTANREQEFIFYKLNEKEAFRERVKQLYRETYQPLLQKLVDGGIDRYASQALPAGKCNSLRWDAPDPLQEVPRIKTYLQEHMDFLDAFWAAEEDYCILEVEYDSRWRSFAVRRGEKPDFLQVFGECQWYVYDTGEPFDVTAPVTQNWVIQTEGW